MPQIHLHPPPSVSSVIQVLLVDSPGGAGQSMPAGSRIVTVPVSPGPTIPPVLTPKRRLDRCNYGRWQGVLQRPSRQAGPSRQRRRARCRERKERIIPNALID